MFEPAAQRKPDVDDEVPESERALEGAPEVEAMAGQMSREEAIAIITSSPAVPLPHRAAMEARFQTRFDHVRCHAGPGIGAALRALGAEAATFGDHVAFGSLEPDLATVAHELAHVVQAPGRGEASDEAQAERVEQGDDAAISEMIEEAKPGGPEGAPALRKKALVKDDLDPADLDEQGKTAGQDQLPAAKVASAIAFNDRKWQGGQRAQLLGHLRGSDAAAGGFTEEDVEHVARIQRGAGVTGDQCDGKIGDTTMAILLHAGLSFEFDEKIKVKASDVQLVFYPGEFEDLEAWKAALEQATKGHEHEPDFNAYRALKAPEGTGRLYVKWKGNLVDVIDCRGGPPMKIIDGTHSADPSKAGTYKLGAGTPHRTDNWYMSQIRWGAKLRANDDNEIEFLDPGSTVWKAATGEKSTLKSPMQYADFVEEDGNLMTEWRLNDFGERAYRVQGSPGLFVHTSPQDEEAVLAGETPVLTHSHGCLHVNPAERQRLEKEGFLQGGVTITIKRYDVHLLPKDMRDQMQGKS